MNKKIILSLTTLALLGGGVGLSCINNSLQKNIKLPVKQNINYTSKSINVEKLLNRLKNLGSLDNNNKIIWEKLRIKNNVGVQAWIYWWGFDLGFNQSEIELGLESPAKMWSMLEAAIAIIEVAAPELIPFLQIAIIYIGANFVALAVASQGYGAYTGFWWPCMPDYTFLPWNVNDN